MIHCTVSTLIPGLQATFPAAVINFFGLCYVAGVTPSSPDRHIRSAEHCSAVARSVEQEREEKDKQEDSNCTTKWRTTSV